MRSRCVAFVVAAGIAAGAFAGEVSFTQLGAMNGGVNSISADGSAVVGFYSQEEEGVNFAFRWNRTTGMTLLPDLAGGPVAPMAAGVSPDGSLVVGSGNDGTGLQPVYWNGGTPVAMGGLGGVHQSSYIGAATSVTTAGGNAVIVGQGVNTNGLFEAFRWTESGGMVGLGTYLDSGPGQEGSVAKRISADGSTIVGQASGEAVYWDSALNMHGLGNIVSGTSFSSIATGVNADGSVVIGNGWGGPGFEAFRWTEDGGMVGIGDLAGGLYSSVANGISGDGMRIVGSSASADSEFVAYLWDAQNGIRSVRSVLEDNGIDIGSWQLYSATAISLDGMTIGGDGINPNGEYDCWVATIPEPGTLLGLLLGAPLVFRRRRS